MFKLWMTITARLRFSPSEESAGMRPGAPPVATLGVTLVVLQVVLDTILLASQFVSSKVVLHLLLKVRLVAFVTRAPTTSALLLVVASVP